MRHLIIDVITRLLFPFGKPPLAKNEKIPEFVYVQTNASGVMKCETKTTDGGVNLAKSKFGEWEVLHSDGRIGNWHSWRWFT